MKRETEAKDETCRDDMAAGLSPAEQNTDEKPYFPLFVDLRSKDILFIGGGSIAARRVSALQPFADRITVVSPEADSAIRQLAAEEPSRGLTADTGDAGAPSDQCAADTGDAEAPAGKGNGRRGVTWIRRPFEEADLQGRDLVFAVTDDRKLNERIAALCGEMGIAVNVSSDKTLCDFYFPGIVREGETVIGISASGRDHRKARRVRERIQEVLEESFDDENPGYGSIK